MPVQKPGRSKQDYATPKEFISATKALLSIDKFLFDFAADRSNAKAERFWTAKTDALTQSPRQWAATIAGGWGWLNPPFSNIAPWAYHCREAKKYGGQIALLIPASVGANWFRDSVFQHAYVIALNGRLAFIPEKPNWLYPKDCILCLFSLHWGPDFDVWSWQS